MIRRFAIATAAIGVLCSAWSATASAQTSDHSRVRERVRAIHQQSQAHQQRIERVSALFVGKPFELSPLGEGPNGSVDTDPIVRFDRFDCVTYVEEVMALSWHADLDRAIEELQRVRYADGHVRYGARKHIMMAQWIPLNVKAGFVQDVTRSVARDATRRVTLHIDAADFRSDKGRALALTGRDQPRGTHQLDVVPLSQMPALLGRVPAGTIITTVRQQQQGVPYRASHVGLVIVHNGERVIRHAHKPSGRVVQQPLSKFVAAAQRYRSWPVVGFNLLRIAPHPPSAK